MKKLSIFRDPWAPDPRADEWSPAQFEFIKTEHLPKDEGMHPDNKDGLIGIIIDILDVSLEDISFSLGVADPMDPRVVAWVKKKFNLEYVSWIVYGKFTDNKYILSLDREDGMHRVGMMYQKRVILRTSFEIKYVNKRLTEELITPVIKTYLQKIEDYLNGDVFSYELYNDKEEMVSTKDQIYLPELDQDKIICPGILHAIKSNKEEILNISENNIYSIKI